MRQRGFLVDPDHGLSYQGRSQEFVSEGDKRGGSVPIVVHTGAKPWMVSGDKTLRNPKNEKMLKLRLSQILYCAEKKFSEWEFRREGRVASCSPLPYAADEVHREGSLFLVWAIIKYS